MKVVVLGSGAGPHRRGSIAISDDGHAWALVNASPDAGRPGHPGGSAGLGLAWPRGLIVTDAQIDHAGGLLALRDGPRLELFATPGVYEHLTSTLPLVNVLQSYCGVRWHMLPVAGDQRAAEFHVHGLDGLRFTALDVTGPVPAHASQRAGPQVGDTVALLVEDLREGSRLFFAPSLSNVGDGELRWMGAADCLMIDGRVHADALDRVGARRKVLVHLAAGDPLLVAGSAQRRALETRGIELAYDGMEIEL